METSMRVFPLWLRSSWRRTAKASFDVVAATAAMFVAFVLRLGPDEALRSSYLYYIPPFAFIVSIAAWTSGLQDRSWSFFSVSDAFLIVRVATISIVLFTVLMFMVIGLEGFPRTVPAIAWFVLIGALAAPRLVYRSIHEGSITLIPTEACRKEGECILVHGATAQTEHLIRVVNSSEVSGLQIIGIIDDAPEHAKKQIRNVSVLGSSSDLAAIARRLRKSGIVMNRLLLMGKSHPALFLQKLVENALDAGLRVDRLQTLEATFLGSATNINTSPLDLRELLGRQTRELDLTPLRELLSGQTVLVTGGGGSIGSEICRQALALGAGRLIILDYSEFNLYTIDTALHDEPLKGSVRACLASVTDRSALFRIFTAERPAFVFHAAAYKHVPLVEHNPLPGIMTNVLGTQNVADAAAFVKTRLFVLISTDKAVNSTNVMGLTKRCAEIYCQSRDCLGEATRFMTVRFGNVLGSSGSVVPRFQQQISKGGPVEVTHAEIRRFFMTISEAVELVITVAYYGLAHYESRGRVHVLDMGEPIRILDLARNMIRLAGAVPDLEVSIKIVGLRPGEKLYEELFNDNEQRVATDTSGVLAAVSRPVPYGALAACYQILQRACQVGDEKQATAILAKLALGGHDNTSTERPASDAR